MMKRSLVILTILVFSLTACSAKATSNSTTDMAVGPAQPPMAESAGGFAADSKGGVRASVPQEAVAADSRIVIKNANLSIVVPDPSASMDVIAAMAESMGGFVVNSNAYKTQMDNGREVPQASITVRVPVERLNEAISKIKEQVENPEKDILSDQISGDDVTQNYTDLQSRLRNLQNAESKLQEIMGSAKDTQDVLNTFNQLVAVQEQIEVLKGQIQYYDQAAALSAISVSLLAKESVQPLTIGGWEPQGTARNAVQTLVDTLKFLGNAIIWIALWVVPTLLILFVVVYLPLRLLLRKLRGNRPPRQPKITAPPAPQV